MTKKKPQPLKISTLFFSYLKSENIRYCHWKSNIRLAESLSGKTDLDVLIHLDDKERFREALERFDFITIVSAPESSHSGLENALGFDHESGRLIHLHIHYKLILGELFIKNHHLQIESFIFEHCKYISGICVPIEELELLILIIRAHMKLSNLAILKRLVIGKKEYYPKDIWEEIHSLIQNCEPERFGEIVRDSGIPLSTLFMRKTFEKFLRKKISRIDTLIIRWKILQAMSSYRIRPLLYSKLQFLWRLIRKSKLVNKIWLGNSCSLSKIGRTIALVGADGAGKSTFADDLSKWLGWKIAVGKIYFGGPKRGICAYLTFLEVNFHILSKKINNQRLQRIAIHTQKWLGIFRLLMAARSRKQSYWKALQKVKKGEIVIFDRYPLPEFKRLPIALDGPEIKKVYEKRGATIAKLEEKTFSSIGQPDLAILLRVSLSELRSRKPDCPPIAQHKLTVDSLKTLDERSGLSIIDGQRPYNEVLLDLKRTIWKQCLTN